MNGAKQSHPREEHLVPLFIALGSSKGQAGQKTSMLMFEKILVSNFGWF